MKKTEYKFEKFIQPQFPIYVSTQSGRKVLVENHYHMAAEIIWVMEGRVQMLIGTVYKEYQKGDIIFIPPSVVHGMLSLTEDAKTLGIVFEFSWLDMMGLKLDFSELFRGRQRLDYVVDDQTEGYGELCDNIRNVADMYGDFSTNSKIQIVSYLLLVMSQLIHIFSLEETVQDKNYLKLRPVLAYIEEHYPEKIQISDLSHIIHVCDDRLIRLFKEVTGETPVEYITNLRIEAGVKLLSSTDLSIADIAYQTGFGSDTYMTRIFKQKLNTTPGKYRHKNDGGK